MRGERGTSHRPAHTLPPTSLFFVKYVTVDNSSDRDGDETFFFSASYVRSHCFQCSLFFWGGELSGIDYAFGASEGGGGDSSAPVSCCVMPGSKKSKHSNMADDRRTAINSHHHRRHCHDRRHLKHRDRYRHQHRRLCISLVMLVCSLCCLISPFLACAPRLPFP